MTEIDPVCGMEVTEEDAAATLDYAGETFLFCSEACRDEFAADPDEYADLDPEEVEPAYEG